MDLMKFFTDDPLIEDGLRYSHDPAALKAWATHHADQFGVKFFLKLDSQIRQANEAHAQESSSWGGSFEDKVNFNMAMLQGGNASSNAERSKALTRVGMAALAACGPRALEWTKSAVGKFIGGLREKIAALPASGPPAMPPPLPSGSTPPPLQPMAAQPTLEGVSRGQGDEPRTIFLSHSRQDLALFGTLKEVEYHLSQKTFFRPWIDHHGIEIGDNLWGAIDAAIKECFAFVVIWSRNAAQSKAVQDELQTARRMGKRIIVCLAEPPGPEFEVPFGLLGIPFFPGRHEVTLGLLQLNQILLSMMAEILPKDASIEAALEDNKKIIATLEHHAIRQRSGSGRPNTVSFIKPMLANSIQALSREPEKEPSMLLFFQRLLHELETDLSIETEDQLRAAARKIHAEVAPVCSDPEYAVLLQLLTGLSS